MQDRSFVRLVMLVVFAMLMGAGGMALAQLSGPATVGAAPREPQKFFCESGTLDCHCKGAADCIDLKNSGQCSGSITTTETKGTCTWVGPPKSPNSTAPVRRPGAKLAVGAPQPPQPYVCEYNKKGVKGCMCRNVGDCLQLDESKLCGSNAIVDNKKVAGAGTCGDWM